ncbi:hypothetical protein QFZ57_001920 [Arthrobacter sp. B1I2]|nr:hypothetical protein [Arthrobacter sp. B1I2]
MCGVVDRELWMRFPGLARLAGFVVLPMASMASPLLALPAVTSQFGATAWVAIAVGQSVGGASAIIVELAWSLTGPQRAARMRGGARRRLLALSISSKLLLFLPMATVSALVSAGLSPQHAFTSALVAIGTTAVGLSSVWYYIGILSVTRIFLTDAMPRLVGVVTASLLVLLGAPLWVYPTLGIIVPSCISPFSTLLAEGVRLRDLRGLTWSRIFLVLRFQSLGMAGRALSGLYIALPVALVTWVAPGSVAIFAAAERLQRICLQLLDAVPNVMQNWLGRAVEPNERNSRIRRAIAWNALLGVVAATAFTLSAPFISKYVFAGAANIPIQLAALSGALIFVVSISKATGNLALVALQRVKVITISALSGALVGIPLILLGSATYGAMGGLIAEIVAEVVVLTIQYTFVASAIKTNSLEADLASATELNARA